MLRKKAGNLIRTIADESIFVHEHAPGGRKRGGSGARACKCGH